MQTEGEKKFYSQRGLMRNFCLNMFNMRVTLGKMSLAEKEIYRHTDMLSPADVYSREI